VSRDDVEITDIVRAQNEIRALRKELAEAKAQLARRVPANWKASVMATVIAQVATFKVRSIPHAHEIVFAVVDEQGLLDRRLIADEVRPLLVNIANNVAQVFVTTDEET
jgi:hypothetical protein